MYGRCPRRKRNLTFLQIVRVQPCMRPVFRVRLNKSRTLLREAKEEVDLGKATGEVPLDSLYVIEKAMQHFFIRAEMGKNAGRKTDEVDEDYKQAAALAALAAPYRHARLSAVKLAGDPNNPVRFKDDATADELREEVMRRLGYSGRGWRDRPESVAGAEGWYSESGGSWRRSIGRQRGVILYDPYCELCQSVSRSASVWCQSVPSVDQCQSRCIKPFSKVEK